MFHKLRIIVFLSLTVFFLQKAKGQDIIYPAGVINLFISTDKTESAQIYNSLKTKAERDDFISQRLSEDFTNTIISRMPPMDPPYWACSNWSLQLLVNSHDFGNNVWGGFGDTILYNGYKGFNLDSIYLNRGTLKDMGKLGLPTCDVTLAFNSSLGQYHGMNAILTGDDITKWESWCFIEPRSDHMYVQPGEENIPLTTEFIYVSYPYLFDNYKHDNNLGGIIALHFTVTNGVPKLEYTLNDDVIPPNFNNYNPHFNKTMRLITQRESDPPVITLKQSVDPDSLLLTVRDANLKSVWYTVNGGEKIPLMTEVLEPVTEKKVAIKMGLTYGNYTIAVGADDYFRLTSQTTTQRNLVNAAPVINVTSPVNGQTYDTKNIPHTLKIPLKVSVVEKEFKSGYYSFDGGKTKVTMKQSEDRNLTLPDGSDYFPDGDYTMTIYAQDNYNLEATKTVKFSVGNVTAIDNISPDSRVTSYPNPTSGLTTITYPAGVKAVVKLFDSSGSLLKHVTDEDQDGETIADVSDFPSGILFYQVLISKTNTSTTNTFSGKIVVKKE